MSVIGPFSLDRMASAVHLRDLIGVGLINQTWMTRFPPELSERLQSLLDTPEG